MPPTAAATRGRGPEATATQTSLPCHVVTQTSLSSASARTQNAGARRADTSRRHRRCGVPGCFRRERAHPVAPPAIRPRQLEGITQRVLTQTLRRLERNGLIQRRVLETSPLGVEYSLTHLGDSFREPFTRLYDWTVEHSDEVLAAQHEYDARSSGH